MNYAALKAEIDSDPLPRGYSGMTDLQTAADLMTAYRSRDRKRMSGSEIAKSVIASEWTGLSDVEQQKVLALMGVESLDPFGFAKDVLVNSFGAGSGTITALAIARVETVTRANELGLGRVAEGDVQNARAL